MTELLKAAHQTSINEATAKRYYDKLKRERIDAYKAINDELLKDRLGVAVGDVVRLKEADPKDRFLIIDTNGDTLGRCRVREVTKGKQELSRQNKGKAFTTEIAEIEP